MALSRNREFLADAGAAEHDGRSRCDDLRARKVEGRADMPVVPAQIRALFLEDGTDSGLSSLMATHPPIGERVAALVRYAGGHDPGPQAPPQPREEAAPPWSQQVAGEDETIRVAPEGATPWWKGPARREGPQSARPRPGSRVEADRVRMRSSGRVMPTAESFDRWYALFAGPQTPGATSGLLGSPDFRRAAFAASARV